MAKILLMILAFTILAFVVFVMCCALVVAGLSDDNENIADNNKGDDENILGKENMSKR